MTEEGESKVPLQSNAVDDALLNGSISQVSHSTDHNETSNQKQKQRALNKPNATLYVSNLDWSIKRPLLKRALLSLFTRHGKVLEVIALRKEGLRGQAFIIFEDVTSATNALNEENNFDFFGKELKIDYAREKSDRIAKRDGTFTPRDRISKQKKTMGTSRMEVGETTGSRHFGNEEKTRDATDADMSDIISPSSHFDSTSANNGEDARIHSGDGIPSDSDPNSSAISPSGVAMALTADHPPSKMLYAQNLPAECTKMMIEMLFRQYAGFSEVRTPREGLAFIEFDDEPTATLALRGLNGFKLTSTETLVLKYGIA